MATTFTSLGVSEELSGVLHSYGITKPTPVQEQAIPKALKGTDVIVQAQTGTGKTLAFALPLLARIDTEKSQTQALVLTPTRELAIQITAEMKKLAPAAGATVLAAYGGQDVEAQIRKLANKEPHIIVATPGRLLDHLRRETVSLGKIRMLVLDEADQMLHMGFLSEVESIIAQMPRQNRQTMLFSATMPEPIRKLGTEYMNKPEDIRIRPERVTVDTIKQVVIETTDRRKEDTLVELIGRYRPYLAVIFCRTKVRAKKLNEALQERGIDSDELHGDLSQAKREQVMKRFREAKLQVLVATDVAARGLDVEGVSHVFNYDIPQDAETYIHRIGRTGRAGNEGMSVTLTTSRDSAAMAHIERALGTKVERRDDSAVARGEAPIRVKAGRDGADRDDAADSRGAASARGGRDGAAGSRSAGGARGGRDGAAGSRSAAGARGGRDGAAGSRGAAGARGGRDGAAGSRGAAGARGGRDSAAGSRGAAGARGGRDSAAGSRGGWSPDSDWTPTAAPSRGGSRGGAAASPRSSASAASTASLGGKRTTASANPWDDVPSTSRNGGNSRGSNNTRGSRSSESSGGRRGGSGNSGNSRGGGRSGGRSNGGGRRGR